MRCSHASWAGRKPTWTSECLDILLPDGHVEHIHGTWMGFEHGSLAVTLSSPWQHLKTGDTVRIQMVAMLWRPALRRYAYRPRNHFFALSPSEQTWLLENPTWDTDNFVVPGPARHQ